MASSFIDTDTAQDVRDLVKDAVNRKANAVINGVTTHRHHPTYITRADLKAYMAQLDGMYDVYVEVMRWENLDGELIDKVIEARVLVAGLYRKRK